MKRTKSFSRSLLCFSLVGSLDGLFSWFTLEMYYLRYILTRCRGAPWRTIPLNFNQFNANKCVKYKYIK
jgi:hypothetical protein